MTLVIVVLLTATCARTTSGLVRPTDAVPDILAKVECAKPLFMFGGLPVVITFRKLRRFKSRLFTAGKRGRALALHEKLAPRIPHGEVSKCR